MTRRRTSAARPHRRKLTGLLLLLAAVLVSVAGWFWASSGEAASTDNAYLRGDVTAMASKVGGYVTSVEVQDNQAVRPGDVLFRIDDRDYRARLAQADAAVDAARARLASVAEDVALQHALVRQAEAQRSAALAALDLATTTSARHRELAAQGWVSRARLDEAETGRTRANAEAEASSAAIDAQRQRIEALGAQGQAAAAALAQAEAARELARIDLENTVVRAPIAGVVGDRQVRVGRLVAPGVRLLDIVPVDSVYVVANFKETQLAQIRSGQRAVVRVDGYPGQAFEGVVDSFAPGSGAAFSLIPPDNATGNFVRVVQRVPVKIRLNGNPLAGRLVPGLSARVEIAREDRS